MFVEQEEKERKRKITEKGKGKGKEGAKRKTYTTALPTVSTVSTLLELKLVILALATLGGACTNGGRSLLAPAIPGRSGSISSGSKPGLGFAFENSVIVGVCTSCKADFRVTMSESSIALVVVVGEGVAVPVVLPLLFPAPLAFELPPDARLDTSGGLSLFGLPLELWCKRRGRGRSRSVFGEPAGVAAGVWLWEWNGVWSRVLELELELDWKWD